MDLYELKIGLVSNGMTGCRQFGQGGSIRPKKLAQFGQRGDSAKSIRPNIKYECIQRQYSTNTSILLVLYDISLIFKFSTFFRLFEIQDLGVYGRLAGSYSSPDFSTTSN